MPVGRAAGRAVDLAGIASGERGLGVIWTQEGSADLNANLVRFEAGEGVGIYVNDEVDVVFVGVSCSGHDRSGWQDIRPGALADGLRAQRVPEGDPERLRRVRIPHRSSAAGTGAPYPLRGYGGQHRRTQHHRKEVDRTKRHPSLRKFSDDHHGGLVQARGVRQVRDGESALRGVARSFLRFWEEDTSLLLPEVKEVLLPVFARHSGHLAAGPI